VAVTSTVPATCPGAGPVSWTVGGDVSQGAVVTVSAVCAERLPAASYASTPMSWLAPQVRPPNVVEAALVEPAGEPAR
jgi:hypothetical protein